MAAIPSIISFSFFICPSSPRTFFMYDSWFFALFVVQFSSTKQYGISHPSIFHFSRLLSIFPTIFLMFFVFFIIYFTLSWVKSRISENNSGDFVFSYCFTYKISKFLRLNWGLDCCQVLHVGKWYIWIFQIVTRNSDTSTQLSQIKPQELLWTLNFVEMKFHRKVC